MDADKLLRLKLAGGVALFCAVIVFAADVIMLGVPVSGEVNSNYQGLATIDDWKLRVGGYGAFAILGFVIGVWQLYEGIKPAGSWWSIPAFLLLSNFFLSGAIFHFALPFIGAAIKAEAQISQPQFRKMCEMMWSYALIPGVVSVASLVLGSIWFAAAVLFRPTYFPRWMAVLAPGLPIGTACLITRLLPAPWGGYLLPPCVHLATPFIFGVSTALLWNIDVVNRPIDSEGYRKIGLRSPRPKT